ncbi:penicillin acylase family protein [Kutzneria sp. NPDC052558]|uniref:penicillin acylase family protein n=1 Tax=Kutzneria sp. NPDC052558 TaxID=3364121 RepID=UPI0037C63EB6
MLSTLRRVAALASVVVVAAAGAPVAQASGWLDGAVIRRTEYGIPHIVAKDFKGLGYGYGYAFAEDNLCALADAITTVDGDRSRYFGPNADSGNQIGGPISNIDSDVFHRSVIQSGIVERTMSQPAPLGQTAEVKDLVSGYIGGVNAYLAATGAANLPDPTCRAKPWVHPITTTEMDRLLYDGNQFGGVNAFQPQIANARPAGSSPSAADALARTAVDNADLGSNGIAAGSAGTRNGDGLLLANPHFPWLGSNRFYQVQLTIPGVMDVTGASVYGTPIVEIGHTKHLAWTHTVSSAQRFTFYELHLAPGDPTSYLVDGQAVPMGRRSVSVPQADGSQITRTVYTSQYGPVLGTGWTATTALAVKGVNVDNGRSSNEWLRMGMSDSVALLRAAQDKYQALPYVNTMAADSTGAAYYADSSVVPHVTDALAAKCVDSPLGKAVYPAQTILDGSLSACAWGSDPDAIVPGTFGPKEQPSLSRTDFVTNSNDSYWLANPAAPLTGYPVIYGLTGTPRTLRTRLGLETIGQRIAGTDGLGSPGFSVASTQQALFADRNLSAELARDAVVSLCGKESTLTASDGTAVDVSAACGVLAKWDLRADPGSVGAVLWRQFWLGAVRAPDLWLVPFDPKQPATTPNTVNTNSIVLRQALANAVQQMAALHVPVDAPLSAAQHTTVGGPDIAIPGCGNPEGCYNIVSGVGSGALGADGRFSPSIFGSSFMMVAELSPRGPVARTLLSYSESANPASPHHGDQTALFAAKKWVADRFSEGEILSSPSLSIRVLTFTR